MGYALYRSGSVPAALYQSSSVGSLSQPPIVKSRRLPSYCPAQGQYYGFTCPRPAKPVSKALYQTPNKARVAVAPPHSLTSTRYFDLGYPTRTFGTRLSKGSSAASMTRPEIYEEVYGISYLPGYGRDSYSAYKIAGATMDDSDDLISTSVRRDNQALRNVAKTIADIGNPSPKQKVFVRASSVPPQRRYNTISSTQKTGKPARIIVKNRPVARSAKNDLYYQVSLPKTQCEYVTVNKGSELLTGKEKMHARECVDLSSPSGTLALKLRLAEAQENLAKQGALLSRYTPNSEDAEIEAELRLMRTNRALRAQSVR